MPESNITGSGSVQSHLSTTNSQQRLRATTVYTPVHTKEVSSPTTSPVLASPNPFTSALRSLLHLADAAQFEEYHATPRSWKCLAFKWMGLVYCFCSFIFTTTTLYKFLSLENSSKLAGNREKIASSLALSSTELQMSRLFSHSGGSRMLEPFLLFPTPSPAIEITACAWITNSDESLLSLISWASQWSGPISLIITTAAPQHSVQHNQLMSRLKSLRNHASLNTLSVHLVHATNGQHSPSTYLNLARLFASTRMVMLYPANLSNPLPHNFHETLKSHLHLPAQKPCLITTTSTANSVFSLPDLTPILLPRNHQTWCTERSFLASRTLDWSDCIWQLWLDEYGLGHTNTTVHVDTETELEAGAGLVSCLVYGGDAFMTFPEKRLRNRMSAKYRAEVCEAVTRRLWPADTSRMPKRKLQWLKTFCRQTENAAKSPGYATRL